MNKRTNEQTNERTNDCCFRHADLVPVRQLVAILQCAEDHDFIDAQRRSSDSDPGVDAATPKARREGARRPSKGGKNPRGEKKKKGRRASFVSKKQKKKKPKSKSPKNRMGKGPVSKLQPIDESSGARTRVRLITGVHARIGFSFINFHL